MSPSEYSTIEGVIRQTMDIKLADDCPPCGDCGEPYCESCDTHYADCKCLGPNSVEELTCMTLAVLYDQGYEGESRTGPS